jgi:hypothetical protein
MCLEGLGQLKNPTTSSGTKPATFQLIAECLSQLRHRVPQVFPYILCKLDITIKVPFYKEYSSLMEEV